MAVGQRPRIMSIPPIPSFSSQALPSDRRQFTAAPQALKSPLSATLSHNVVEQDYSRLRPDELFARLSVAEVKNIHGRLRNEADSKQEELRLMVGERYRDLLQASTSIITISAESKRVTAALAEVEEASQAEDSTSVQPIPRKTGPNDSDLSVLQSLSAHLKLLLDAPEQLWRLLEKHNYLHAAWLFLISRVVYRSLLQGESQDDEDIELSWARSGIDVSEQFPLAQRQWDTISQFRTQISHKATQSLRTTSRTPRETCDTLVSILLLDSIPVSETVTLLLSQRSKALRTLLSKLNPSSDSPSGLRSSSPLSSDRQQNRVAASALLTPRSPSPARARSASTSTRLTQRNRRENIHTAKDALKQTLDLIISTVEAMGAIFGGDRDSSSGATPLVEQILESVQSTSAEAAPHKRSRHAHRMSVISSFHATPAPIPSNSPSQPLTSTMILDSLPSSQLLLQFLPASIVSYSPYVDTASAKVQLSGSVIPTASAAWFDASLAALKSNLGSWFDRLDSIRSVCEVRNVLADYKNRLSASELSNLVAVVDEACANRARSVWSASLQGIARTAEKLVEGAAHSIQQNDKVAMSSAPARFSSSQIPLPSMQSAPKEGTFVAYKAALQRKIVMRDPLLDQTITAIEDAAHHAKNDFDFILKDESARHLASTLSLACGPQAEQTVLAVAEYISVRLKAAAEDEVVTFLGRLSAQLGSNSRFVGHLVGVNKKAAYNAFLSGFEASLNRWLQTTLDLATSNYGAAFVDSGEDDSSKFRASPSITRSLFRLIDAIHHFGLSSSELHKHQVPRRLLEGFADRLASLHGGQCQARQVAWDIAFVRRLVGTLGSDSLTNGKTQGDFGDTIDLQLERWQTLLGPLLGPTSLSTLTSKFPNRKSTASHLLPLGTPPAEEDFTTAVQLVKPGPRFAMLLVGKGGTRK